MINLVGRPSKAYLTRKAERIEFLNILRPKYDTQVQPNATTNTILPTTQVKPSIIPPSAIDLRPRHRYRNFTLAFKHHIATYAESHSIRATATHFGLDRRTVRLWIQIAMLVDSLRSKLIYMITSLTEEIKGCVWQAE